MRREIDRIYTPIQPGKRSRARFTDMKTSTTDKVEGAAKQVKGTIKQAAGKATGDVDLQDRGAADKLAGKAQSKVGDIKKVFDK